MALVAKADLYDVKKISFSYDGGRNWFQPPNEAPNSVGGGSVAVAADAKSVIWTPENASPAVTTDNGNSWKSLYKSWYGCGGGIRPCER